MEVEKMRASLANIKNKKQLESILLVCVLVATSMIVIFPLTAPKAKAVVHDINTMLEDNGPNDMNPMLGIVEWAANDDHIINNPLGYTVNVGYTLNIPNLNYRLGLPSEFIIDISNGNKIDVFGTLMTNPMPGIPNPPQWTAFTSTGIGSFDGIYFHPGSSGHIRDCIILNSINGIVMLPGSSLIDHPASPANAGVWGCRFETIVNYGMQMDGVTGLTNIAGSTNFYEIGGAPGTPSGTGLVVQNGSLNIDSTVTFNSHGSGLPSLRIANADVYLDQVPFYGDDQAGYSVLVEGDCDGTVFDACDFTGGVAGNHYIRCDGSAPLIDNNTFDFGVGQLSVSANDNALGFAANPILRNPNPPGTTFDNTSMDVTGGSSLTLQWYLDVFVEDSDGHLIANRQVWVNDNKGNPATPGTKMTDVTGWAKWFLCTEFIQYTATFDNFNQYNKSALNNTLYGYSLETMDMSKTNTIIVPVNPIPNTPPSVSSIQSLSGTFSGLISVDFTLNDVDPGDDGHLYIELFWSTDGATWNPATIGPGSDSIDLNTGTPYTVFWTSDGPIDLPDQYEPTVWIQITPYDTLQRGTSDNTGPFTVDNKAPMNLTAATVTVTNTTAIIEWTVDEPAQAAVWYGLDPDLTDEETNLTYSTTQKVELSGLLPGRVYSYMWNSTDPEGNKRSSIIFTFRTEVHIQLYKGWNMISIPGIPSPTLSGLLAPIAGQYDAVQAYMAIFPADPWKHYAPGKTFGNDLKQIIPQNGFWIHMKNDAVFIPDYSIPPMLTVNLVAGWNFVGYPSVTDRLVTDALSGVPYDMVQTYDAASGQWLSYDPGGYSLDNLSQMEMGKGYWIHATSAYGWSISYI
jgi:hypothetical protein